MAKVKSLIEKHYYALFFFIFVMVYSCVIPGELKLWKTDELTLSFHAVDYSMGFCSRFLPGAIYNFFFDSISERQASIYLTVLMVVFFAVLSVLLERLMLNVDSEYRFTALVVLLFFLTGPSTFAIFINVLGMLDVYWVFAAILFFILLSNKHTHFLLFVPFLICILVYYVTWLCYIPFFAIIVLYRISISETKKEKSILWVSLIVSVVSALGLTLYFVIFEKGNLTYTLDEFLSIFYSKNVDPAYYGQSIYYYDIHSDQQYGTSKFILEELYIRLSVNFKISNLYNKIPLFLLLLPIVAFIYKFLLRQIKSCDIALKKFSFVCMMLLFAGTMAVSVIATTDLIRWTGHAFLPLFAAFLYVLYNEGDLAWMCLKENLSKYSFKTVMVFLIFYASVIYNPYFV